MFSSITSRIREVFANKLIASIAIALAVTMAIFSALTIWILYGPLVNSTLDEQTNHLESVARTGAYAIEQNNEDLQTAVTAMMEQTGVRATVMKSDGTVIADSLEDPTTLENHLDRPEVQAALNGAVGHDTRLSESSQDERLYVAVPFIYDGEQAVFRTSEPLSEVYEIVHQTQVVGITFLIIWIAIVIGFVIVAMRSALKPASELDRVRTDFVANASHELKTPVAGIRLLAETIQTAAADDELDTVQAFAERLDGEAQRLQRLVTDLLDLSRLEQSNTATVLRTKVDLHAIINTSVESRRGAAERKGVKLVYTNTTPDEISERIDMTSADASLIVDNLIDNALRYSDEGGTVHVTLDCDNRRAKFSVADEGVGIAPADIPRIFERFYRIDVARSREGGGTGLGLSLVRHAVLRAKGTVEVESELGSGSTFTVRIPRNV